MLNGIAAKAIIPVSCAVTGFVIVGCLLLHAYIRNDMIADTIRNEAGLAGTIVKSTRYAMLKTDREMLQQTIEDIGSQPGVEHVRIFNKRGVVMFSSDPGEIHRALNKHDAGCSGCHSGPVPATSLGTMEQARRFVDGRGHEVLAITAPVYNEASCVAAACHQGPSAAKVLGTLDIGFSTVAPAGGAQPAALAAGRFLRNGAAAHRGRRLCPVAAPGVVAGQGTGDLCRRGGRW